MARFFGLLLGIMGLVAVVAVVIWFLFDRDGAVSIGGFALGAGGLGLGAVALLLGNQARRRVEAWASGGGRAEAIGGNSGGMLASGSFALNQAPDVKARARSKGEARAVGGTDENPSRS